MPPRRTVLEWLAAIPALVGARRAHAAPQIGEVFDGEPLGPPQSDAHGAPREDGPGPVRLGRLLPQRPGAPRGVFSISNANDRYAAVAPLVKLPQNQPYLMLPGGPRGAASWGSGFGSARGGSASFHLDRASADALAAIWRIERKDRRPLGAGLVGSWRAAQPLRLGSPLEITLKVQNTGAPVGFSVGGRQRGPRDNRFAFTIEAGGKVLPVIDAPDFGGPLAFRLLKSGDSVELTADLARWIRLETAGSYRVRCSYQAELVPGQELPQWPERGHETWDLTLTDSIDIVIGP